MVNISTGSVFSLPYSDFRILLMIPDRVHLQVGEFIRFQAKYFPLADAYVIYAWEPMKGEFSLNGIPTPRGFLVKYLHMIKDLSNIDGTFPVSPCFKAKGFSSSPLFLNFFLDFTQIFPSQSYFPPADWKSTALAIFSYV